MPFEVMASRGEKTLLFGPMKPVGLEDPNANTYTSQFYTRGEIEGSYFDGRWKPVIGVNYKDQPDNARRFIGRYGNPFVAVGSDPNGRAAIDWGVYGAPESFLVDGKGIVRWKHVGPLTDELIAKELLPLVTRIEAER